MGTFKRRLLGLLFFVVVIGLLATSVLKFRGTFDDYSMVTLRTDNAGNSLVQNADVKANGVIVGNVRQVNVAPGGKVSVELNITPDEMKNLPVGTTARVLPKTLFGERYVALQIPEKSTGGSLHDGAVIKTDQKGNAAEVEDLFDALLPVIEAIPPQDLNVTLSAISQAIAGKGKEIGQIIDRLDTIFKRVNAKSDDLEGTIQGLATFSQTYAEAVPDIIDSLDNLRITGNTFVEREGDFRSTIQTLGVAATDTTKFLKRNKKDMLNLFIDSEPFLKAIARQSPTFGCMFHNFATLVPKSKAIVGDGTPNPGVRVNLQFVNPRGRYLPNQDEPRLLWVDPPARCYEPATNGRPFPQYPGGGVPDGSYQPPSRNAGPRNIPNLPQPQFSATPSGKISESDYQNQLRVLYGASSGISPENVPLWVTSIGAGTLQGAQVNVK
ncbi:MCE family protein [Gordonia sp. (in: high G+C Gram-positive bacteria)]|uniref:MCE family protein n=1 Tax=Gordonia sp. (in: high G+C Gram-positive bacteria) TaxID=84139 RepID=UPI0016BBDC85|nr:MCE family protein [Gordonia sp. (in: high G+C Gram-positive bacteria)]NLG47796.1 MCE family protein [Gordonia sp. (in: high G+C Gram-positive bacteria)]